MEIELKRILFRCDSSSTIGLGHVKRCLVLAKRLKELNKNLEIFFSTLDLEGNINFEILKEGFSIYSLKDDSVSSLDYVIKGLSIDFLVIDSYKIDINFETQLKLNNNSLKIMSFDDILNSHNVDFILNHGIQAKKHIYKELVPKNCKILCGNEYTLLRDEFLEAKKAKKRVNKKIKTIFLAMGGADHKNLNIKILKVVEKFKKSLKVNLVTTTANKHLEELKEYCKDKKWINLQINSNKVAKLMSKSDFSIVTPSVTANEIFYLDLPMIAIKTAKNQKEMYKYLKKQGYSSMKNFDKRLLEKSIIKLLGD